jgi:PST family polysaccharide transporter
MMASMLPNGAESQPPTRRLDVGRLGRQAAGQLIVRAVAMRAVTLVGTVALARLLAPADFGIYAVVILVITVVSGLGDFGLGGALIQQSHEPTDRELATTWTAQLAIWGAIVALIVVLAPLLAAAIPALGEDGVAMIRVASLVLVFSGLRSLPSTQMSRILRFGPLAAIEVIQQVVFFGLAVGLAWIGAGPWSFIVAAVSQTAVGALLVNLAWGRFPGFGFDRAIVRRLLGFGLGYQATYIVTWLRDGVVTIFGGLAGGVNAIGLLGFAWRNGQIVSSLDEIIGRVVFPAISRIAHDRRALNGLADAVVIGSIAIGVVQAWIIGVAPVLVPIVFGPAWSPAVPALQLVCLGTFATIPTRFLSSTLFAVGQSQAGLRLSAISLAVLFVAFPILVLAVGLVGGGLAFALAAVVGLVLHARATRSVVPMAWTRIGRIYAICAFAACASAVVVTVMPSMAGLIVSGVVEVVAFFGLMAAVQLDDLRKIGTVVRPGAAPPLG